MLKRSYPLRALKAAKLLRRIPLNYYKRPLIEELFHREDSGYWGEKNLDYYLSFLPEGQYFIFQRLRLKYEKWTFQIDFLLLTTKFALIIEAKYFTAKLHFDSQFNQLIQTNNDKEKCFDDPIAQVKKQQYLLSKWLKKHTSLNLPIHHLVVFSNPNAILQTDPGNKEVLKKVCKPFKLLEKINEIERLHLNETVETNELRKTCKYIAKHHLPEEFNILEYFKITTEEIAPGVYCELCDKLPMEYKRGKWYCPFCEIFSKTAHIESLNDYFFLINNGITNSEFRAFLNIPTIHVAQKLLLKLDLPSTGKFKNKVYYRKDGGKGALPEPRRQAAPRQIQS